MNDKLARKELDMPAQVHREDTGNREIMEAILHATRDPSVDAGKLEKLLGIHERLLADQRRAAYVAALARLQAQLPQIRKTNEIRDRDGNVRNRYASMEDIDEVVRPLCAAEGFAFTYDSKPAHGGNIEFSCTMSHRDGHTETRSLVLPIDAGGGRTAVQSIGSTTSYARRYILSMHLNLVTRDEDDDANGGGSPVTPEQAQALRDALKDSGRSEEKFLAWLKVESFEEIPSRQYEAALRQIAEAKRRATK